MRFHDNLRESGDVLKMTFNWVAAKELQSSCHKDFGASFVVEGGRRAEKGQGLGSGSLTWPLGRGGRGTWLTTLVVSREWRNTPP